MQIIRSSAQHRAFSFALFKHLSREITQNALDRVQVARMRVAHAGAAIRMKQKEALSDNQRTAHMYSCYGTAEGTGAAFPSPGASEVTVSHNDDQLIGAASGSSSVCTLKLSNHMYCVLLGRNASMEPP